jgi:hypothetical protein
MRIEGVFSWGIEVSFDEYKKMQKQWKKRKQGAEFVEKAEALEIQIADTDFEAKPQIFSRYLLIFCVLNKSCSGNFGWGVAGKVLKTEVEGHDLNVQVTVNLVVKNEGKKEEEEDKDISEDNFCKDLSKECKKEISYIKDTEKQTIFFYFTDLGVLR